MSRAPKKISKAERNGCFGKKKYKYQSTADFAMQNVKRNMRDKHTLNAYKCDFCGFYHVGHKYPNVQQRQHNSKR